jgi:hypothetical protein
MTTEFKVGDVVMGVHSADSDSGHMLCVLLRELPMIGEGSWIALRGYEHRKFTAYGRVVIYPSLHAPADTPEAKALLAQFALMRLSE